MLIAELTELAEYPVGRLLGLDHGSKTIGVALSDVLRSIASPLVTISRKNFAYELEQLKTLVTEHRITGLVIGYPLNMDGSEGTRCQSVRAFVRNIESHIDLPMLLVDERLSSHTADEAMLSANLSRRKRSEKIDKVAAAVILQGALDELAKLERARHG